MAAAAVGEAALTAAAAQLATTVATRAAKEAPRFVRPILKSGIRFTRDVTLPMADRAVDVLLPEEGDGTTVAVVGGVLLVGGIAAVAAWRASNALVSTIDKVGDAVVQAPVAPIEALRAAEKEAEARANQAVDEARRAADEVKRKIEEKAREARDAAKSGAKKLKDGATDLVDDILFW